MQVCVVGAGLAGCEAAWQAAERGAEVTLHEMKPQRFSPAHHSEDFAELVCSNSLRADGLGNAVGLLKEEMRCLGSLVMQVADASRVPAGRALAVDRHAFSRRMTERVAAHPRIQVQRREVLQLPEEPVVVLATGPLTSEALAAALQERIGDHALYFYDAISPIVHADSVDPEMAFRASRWEDGPGDYLNLPLDEGAYERFVDALLEAETVPLHAFEKALFFEGCLPIEEMARRGRQTLAHGPMKPVGLRDPRDGRPPFAVVQLRHEDSQGMLLNFVGFQTKLRIACQQHVFRMLPGMAGAVFARYGSVHRNTFLDAPQWITPSLELRGRAGLFVAGQMAGVEGYVESAALGLLAGVNAAFALRGQPAPVPDPCTAHGALLTHLRGGRDGGRQGFQPSNVNYGLFPPLADAPRKLRKREKNARLAERALAALPAFGEAIGAPRRAA